MKTLDLNLQQITIEDLLNVVGTDIYDHTRSKLSQMPSEFKINKNY